MCGRYASFRSDAEVARSFAVEQLVDEEQQPSWNVAPTQAVRVVIDRQPRATGDTAEAEPAAAERHLRRVRWGLVPSWAKDVKIGARMINARSETVTEKPAFKRAAARRRALVPMDGYYEWQKNPDGSKTPYFLHDGDELLAAAGLYELWPDPSKGEDAPDRWLWSATIITRPATDALGHIHDRCPVLLTPDLVNDWLDPNLADLNYVRHLLEEIPESCSHARSLARWARFGTTDHS